MAGLINSCENYFGSRNLYEVLKIAKTASDNEVKKAYRKLSLIVHPDRVTEENKDEATEKFKVLSKVHSILSDKEKRATYDDTGCIDEEDCGLQDRNWYDYWRLLFKEISVSDIMNYEKQYKGSNEEIEDLRNAYEKGKGDMDIIFESVPFTTLSEEPRIVNILKNLIEQGNIPSYTAFINEDPKKKQRRKRKLEKEAKEAEKAKKEILEKKKRSRQKENVEDIEGDEDVVESDVMKALLQRKKEREAQADSFFDHLAAKYGNKEKKSKQKKNRK